MILQQNCYGDEAIQEQVMWLTSLSTSSNKNTGLLTPTVLKP